MYHWCTQGQCMSKSTKVKSLNNNKKMAQDRDLQPLKGKVPFSLPMSLHCVECWVNVTATSQLSIWKGKCTWTKDDDNNWIKKHIISLRRVPAGLTKINLSFLWYNKEFNLILVSRSNYPKYDGKPVWPRTISRFFCCFSTVYYNNSQWYNQFKKPNLDQDKKCKSDGWVNQVHLSFC